MKAKKLFALVPFLITVLFIAADITAVSAGQPNEIKIHSGSELIAFLEKGAGDTSKRAVLYADVTLSKEISPSILSCELDGNGHMLMVKETVGPYLFETVTETGAVRNLVLSGKIGGSTVAAGIALQNRGTVENCVIKAEFSGAGFASGICHTNSGKIANCFERFSATGEEYGYVRNHICAENYGSVQGCYYSTGEDGTVGAYIKGEEMEFHDLFGTLNSYAERDSRLVGWKAGKKGSPTLDTKVVLSGGSGILLVFVAALIIAVTAFTGIYSQKQKKKIIHDSL